MRTRVLGAIVAGVLLGAGVAAAQTPGPSVEPGPRGIIPVTGPSTVPGPSESAKTEVVPAVAQGETVDGVRKVPERPKAATATHAAPRSAKTAKVGPKPASKTSVKKASAGAPVAAKATGPHKKKQVVAAKHSSPAHHAAAGKPIPVSKPQPAAKSVPPAQPVLPRV